MKGKVKNLKYNKQNKIIGYEIKGEDEKTYFAHLGDLHENENLLYDVRDKKLKNVKTVYNHYSDLKNNQEVKFKTWDEAQGKKGHAFNVKKIDK